jgi:hypothetical protein
MMTVTEEVYRVINHNEFHQYITGLITDSGPRFRSIVGDSEKYDSVTKKIKERMRSDFEHIEEKTKQFSMCRDINKFDQDFDFEQFKQENKDLEPIKEQFEKLGKWENNINKYIKLEEKRGLIVASGRKIKEKLQNRVKKEQDNLRTYLFDLAGKTEKEINNALSQIKTNLNKPISDLKSYVEFVNKLQESKEEIETLGARKTKLEQMKNVLSRNRVKDDTAINNTSKITALQGKID